MLLVKREGKAGGLSALRILSTEFIDYEQIKVTFLLLSFVYGLTYF